MCALDNCAKLENSFFECLSNFFRVKFVFESFDKVCLTLKVPITTAADGILKYLFSVFQRNLGMVFHVNPLLGRGLETLLPKLF